MLALVGGALGSRSPRCCPSSGFSVVNFQSFSEIGFGFALSPSVVARALIFAVVMGVVGGFLPAVRAARLNIVNGAAGVVAGEARAGEAHPARRTHSRSRTRGARGPGLGRQPAWFAATGMQASSSSWRRSRETEREALVRWERRPVPTCSPARDGRWWVRPPAGSRRLARPDRLPPGLERLAPELGRFLAGLCRPARRWTLGGGGGGGALSLDHPVLIGIVNVTPDSFSDGGRFATLDRAVAQAERLAADGCELLDVGGESTRPGAVPVPVEDESGGWRR